MGESCEPTTAADAERGKPLPSLLISVAFGVSQRRGSFTPTEPPPPWPPPESEMPRRSLLTPYEVRLHLFQGRKLPARDANGVLDAYVLASLGGAKLRSATARSKPLRSEVQRETSNPQWYETMQTTVWLPPLSLAPELVLSVWDADVGAAARAVRAYRLVVGR